MKTIKFTLIVLLLAVTSSAYACRFWVAAGDGISGDVVDQLLIQPHSLKSLGREYKDGWSVGYYKNDRPVIWRSALASDIDEQFDVSVEMSSRQKSNIIFAHLRRASSGCVKGVPNPHPFKIEKNGNTWFFGHNGGMNKQILVDLIGDDYLTANPPMVCTEDAPDSWIDSELYFIFLIKSIEEHGWDIELGIQRGLQALYQVIPEEKRYLNFFLTDGNTVWTYRKGTSLFYRQDDQTQKSFVTSTIPHGEQGQWKEFPEYTFAILKPNTHIEFIPVKEHVSIPQTR